MKKYLQESILTKIKSRKMDQGIVSYSSVSLVDDFSVKVERFLNQIDVMEATKDSYRKKLKAFFKWIDETKTTQITRTTILEYKNYLKSRLSIRSTSAYITPLKLLYGFLSHEYQIDNITLGIGKIKQPRGHSKDSFTLEQVQSVLAVVNRSTLQGKRDYAILNVLFRTGVRSIEVCRALVGDIRQQGGVTKLFVQGKGREDKEQFVLLVTKTTEAIQDYLNHRDIILESEPLFTSISNNNLKGALTTSAIRSMVKRYYKLAGFNSPRLTTHSTRHTFATQALLGGADIMQVKEAMRHQSVETTMVYTRVLDRLKNAAEKFMDF
jgi:integrase/recombinase XerD